MEHGNMKYATPSRTWMMPNGELWHAINRRKGFPYVSCHPDIEDAHDAVRSAQPSALSGAEAYYCMYIVLQVNPQHSHSRKRPADFATLANNFNPWADANH
ncbi:hypothetical protein ACMFMF_005632 [Clarireedia jacksonii]